MQQRDIEIVNKLGLHARASAKLTQLAGQFAAEVWISREGRKVCLLYTSPSPRDS